MPQLFVLYPNLTINQTMGFMASVYGLSREYRRRRIDEVLTLVGLQDHRRKRAQNISGGMQRRLELACALLHEPSILFFDEPTAGVDPVLRARFWEHFHALRDAGNTLFVTTQYVTEAEYCDQVALMDEGRLVALGSPKDLRREALGGEVLDITAPAFGAESLEAVRALEGVRRLQSLAVDHIRVYVDSAADALPHVLSVLEEQGIEVASAQDYNPSFDEIFVRLLEAHQKSDAPSRAGAVSTSQATDVEAGDLDINAVDTPRLGNRVL
jgi:ABC-2 type transport system ATP-binding protein